MENFEHDCFISDNRYHLTALNTLSVSFSHTWFSNRPSLHIPSNLPTRPRIYYLHLLCPIHPSRSQFIPTELYKILAITYSHFRPLEKRIQSRWVICGKYSNPWKCQLDHPCQMDALVIRGSYNVLC